MSAEVLADQRFRPGQLVVGVELNGEARAWPTDEGAGEINDEVGGRPVRVVFDGVGAQVFSGDDLLPSRSTFWFAYVAAFPEASVGPGPG